MPLWRIFTNPSTFSTDQKAGLSRSITKLYVERGLPPFYVNVLFIPLSADDVWIGGESNANFVRIAIEQIARTMPDATTEVGKATRKGWMDLINEALKPHIQARPELQWEHHIYETPRDLWRVGGIDPPPPKSEAEKLWVAENRVVPYEV